MNDKKIVRMLQKKTSVYLKISLMLFFLSLISVVTFFIYIQYQHKQTKQNFIDNSNTHIIAIDYKKGKDTNEIYKLSFQDRDIIKELVKVNKKSFVYLGYNINFGIQDLDNNTFFVKGISNNAMDYLGIENLRDDMAYCNGEIGEKEIVLQIPYIKIAEGGFVSSKLTELTLNMVGLDTIIQPFNEMKNFNDTIYVNENTFKKIIQYMYDTSWDTFVNDYENGKTTGIQVIDKIYLYVEDMKDVNQLASKLEKKGYINQYVLNAFDDLYHSLNVNNIFLICMLIFIFSLTTFNVINSFQSYIYNMQKDMGILMHYGYSKERVYNIYKNIVLRPYAFLAIILLAYTIILSLLVLNKDVLTYILWTILLVIFMFEVVIFKLLLVIKKVCKKEVLILIKASKESE